MAFSSISNRLWLTYLFVILLVLIIAFAGIAVAFQRSPILYRQTFYRISLVNGFLTERLTLVYRGEWEPFIQLFLNEVKITDIKIAVLNNNGEAVLLAAGTSIQDIPEITDPASTIERSHERILTYRDENKKYWFYQISQIDETHFLVTLSERPEIAITVLFQDELLRPLFRAGIIALVISFIIGWFIARWITQPLEKISKAADQIADGNYVTVPIEGPSEVKQLANTMNEMVIKVEDSMQSQRDFVANVSHEFKTPLTSIQGFAQALSDDVINTKQETKKAADIILGETQRLNHLVNDLLLLARLDAGTVGIEKTKTDLNQLITNTVERFRFQVDDKHLSVKKEFSDKLEIWLDGEKIGQVLNNLIDNAIKFSPDRSEIGISSSKKNGWVLIQIQDSGPGISAKDQKRIFERFFQIDESRKGGPGRGVGLGLAIAKQIILAHGGDIEVKSKPGEGSTFMVKLPITHDQKYQKPG
ncbi:MAG: HAMP domain-containing histidine kinase [Chloroflexi bacterium]|nr:HAMP domain-containing histidine kinase [Chloroflexota bacterium]